MSDHVDDWHKLASYDTNIQGELHANLLKNNGIPVSVQALSAIPGMNSGSIIWVKKDDLETAKQILDSIDKDLIASDLNSGLENEAYQTDVNQPISDQGGEL